MTGTSRLKIKKNCIKIKKKINVNYLYFKDILKWLEKQIESKYICNKTIYNI